MAIDPSCIVAFSDEKPDSTPHQVRGRLFPENAPTPDALHMPRDSAGPVFHEPWEAQAFAMAVALRERGLFTWNEWAATLAHEIKAAQAAGDPDSGDTYYRHWLNALERLVAEKNVASDSALARYREAWRHAAGRTPHGVSIALADEDFGTRKD